jgi:hypothetical protein
MAAISAERRRDMQYSRRRNRLSSRYVYSRWMAGNFTRRFLEALGGHCQASRTRLRVDARGGNGGAFAKSWRRE